MWVMKKHKDWEYKSEDIVQPSNEYIQDVVSGSVVVAVYPPIPRQYVNWVNKKLGIDHIYHYGDKCTVKSLGILYIACVNYLEELKNASQ